MMAPSPGKVLVQQRPARHSTIHVDRPDAVVQAIRDLLDRIENGVAGPSRRAASGPGVDLSGDTGLSSERSAN
jgi:hypothetical protein